MFLPKRNIEYDLKDEKKYHLELVINSLLTFKIKVPLCTIIL